MDSLDKQIQRLSKKLDKISKVETARAYSSAVNKTAAKIKTAVAKSVAADVKIAQKNIKRKIFIKRSTPKSGVAKITLYGKPINAIHTNFNKQSKGYKVGGQLVPRSFFAKSPAKAKHFIWQRKGIKRLPIEMVRVPIQKAIDRHAMAIIKQKMDKDFFTTLKSEFNARLKGYVKTSN